MRVTEAVPSRDRAAADLGDRPEHVVQVPVDQDDAGKVLM
jgi:hypothetical protein